MTTKFQAYQKYKNSVLAWAKKFPVDWDVVPTRSLMKTKKERVGATASDYVLLSLTLGGVIPRDLDEGSGKYPAEYDTYQMVLPNDLVMCLFDYDVTPRTVGHVTQKGIVTGAYTRLIPKSAAYSKYYYYYFLWLDTGKELLHLCTGLRNVVSKHIFWSLLNPLPPLETQKQIADFLDEKTKVIDELVAKKERLIELLREKRAALITRAVTKGLDPRAKLKPSGVEWLGDIPERWEVKKLKFIASVQASNVDKKSYEGEKEVLLCNYVDVYKNEFISSKLSFMSATATSEQVYKLGLQIDDVIITKDSETPDDIGVAAIVIEDIKNLVCGYHLYLLRAHGDDITGNYLFRFLQSRVIKGYFETRSNGVTRFGLGSYGVKNVSFPVPSLQEQKQIADFLDVETAKIDKAVALIESQIEKLKEYRSSLIYSAVTGKVKV